MSPNLIIHTQVIIIINNINKPILAFKNDVI